MTKLLLFLLVMTFGVFVQSTVGFGGPLIIMPLGLMLLQIAGDSTRNDDLPESMTLFLAGRGASLMEALSLPYGSSFTLPESTFTPPEGQVFDHWELNDRPVDSAEPLTVSGDGVLTAVYRGENETPKAGGAPVSSTGSAAVDTVRNLSSISTVTKVLILGVPLLLIVLVLFLAINSGRRRR